MKRKSLSLCLALLPSLSWAQSTPVGYRTNDTIAIEEISIGANRTNNAVQLRSTQNLVRVDNQFLECNFNGGLAQTLSIVPGVSAMSVGSGQAKLAIRGLSFNRMVVAENGIKHQGQQWGDDHGLELDMFSVDHVEVTKGPAALAYGSDAIGGVVSVATNAKPSEHIEGKANVFFRSNNLETGLTWRLAAMGDRLFARAEMTAISYADYRVPTDSIQYYSYFIQLKDQTMRNTAGRELDGALTIGFLGEKAVSTLRISETFSKNGFFANAHGLEVRLSEIDYDKSRRDVDLPYHRNSHTKLSSNSHAHIGKVHLNADLGLQLSDMEERSEPVSHGYMPQPDGTLERHFRKLTTSANIAAQTMVGKHSLRMGLQTEWQRNKRGGWGFVIPDFRNAAAGIYVTDKLFLGEETFLFLGLRADLAKTRIEQYADWFKTPIANSADSAYLVRSAAFSKQQHSLTWSAGFTHSFGLAVVKANIGKSFRMPQPHELGADGVNYHIFRYERGNANLDPEVSYQLDAGLSFENERLSAHVDPFVNLFPNYIYLNPSSDFVEGLQLYSYTQSRVLRFGAEMEVEFSPTQDLSVSLGADFVKARQLSGDKKGFTIPFAPPASARLEAEYSFSHPLALHGVKLGIEVVGVAKQDDIVPPEKTTDGHVELGASFGKDFSLGSRATLSANITGHNLLDSKFYDHTSFYRLIDAPEQGRDISIMLGLKF